MYLFSTHANDGDFNVNGGTVIWVLLVVLLVVAIFYLIRWIR